jgi:hypothetical protein
MIAASNSGQTLYEALAVDVPGSARAGETISTKAKETIDNDAEVFLIGGWDIA